MRRNHESRHFAGARQDRGAPTRSTPGIVLHPSVLARPRRGSLGQEGANCFRRQTTRYTEEKMGINQEATLEGCRKFFSTGPGTQPFAHSGRRPGTPAAPPGGSHKARSASQKSRTRHNPPSCSLHCPRSGNRVEPVDNACPRSCSGVAFPRHPFPTTSNPPGCEHMSLHGGGRLV